MFEKSSVYSHWGVGPWEGREPGGLAGSHILFGCTDVLGGGSGQEVRPVMPLGSFDCLEVPELQELREEDCVFCWVLLDGAGALVVFFA